VTGPSKMGMYLKRYHQVTVSASGIWRISDATV